MKTETKVLGVILILTLALLGGGIFFLARQSGPSVKGTQTVQIDYSKGQKIGSDSAKVRLVEFSDFSCSACALVNPYLRKITATYPDDVQLIYRHLLIHQSSRSAVTVAEAAGQQGKFWQIHDRLFETQDQWSTLSDPVPFFLDLAKDLGLDTDKIKKAIETDEFKSKIDADAADGQSLGVSFTPTFFLNGRKLFLQKFEDLSLAIEQEIKK